MKISSRKLSLILCLIMLGGAGTFAKAQKVPDEALNKIECFIKGNAELQTYSTTGYTSEFARALVPIPETLQSTLSETFPQYKFYVARMNVLIDAPPRLYDLILIADSRSGAVKGFVWAKFWVLPPSQSFPTLLEGHESGSKETALKSIEALSSLINLNGDAVVSSPRIQNGKVKVDFVKGEAAIGILEVKIGKRLKYGRMLIMGPDGKRMRYFV